MSEALGSGAVRNGALIDQRYRLGEALGHGGMSRVFRAVDEALGREVAVKLLREPLLQHTERFEREARTMGRLRHPAVVKVYGYGLTPGEEPGAVLPYLVLELVDDAVSLMTLIEQRGQLVPAEAVRLMRPIAGALAEAHANGIVHRDLKPENILLQYAAGLEPQLRLLDFGIAAWDEPTAQRLTQTGQIFGTPAYMAPEHATGQFGAGPTADVWSLGVILHEMVSGECPFRGPHVTATLFNITNKPAPPLEGIDPGYQALVDDCLRKDHTVRLPDAAAVLDRLTALAEAQRGPGSASDPAGAVQAVGAGGGEAAGGEPGEHDTAESPRVGRPVTPAPSLSTAPTLAISAPPRARRAPLALSGMLGLVLGVALGLAAGGGEQPSAPSKPGLATAHPPSNTDGGPAPDSEPPPDSGPPPLVDDALSAAMTFIDGGDPERALAWLAANPEAGNTDARDRLHGLAQLSRGKVGEGLERLDPLLTRRPDLSRDPVIQAVLLGSLGDRDAGGLVDMLGVMLEVSPGIEERLLTLTDHDDYRTRRRAFRTIQQAGHDVEAAAYRYYVRNLRLLDCDLRKHAVERLRALGNPGAIGPIKAMDNRTGFFDNLCMDGAVDRALGTLYVAERRAARAEGRAEVVDLGTDAAADVRDAGPSADGPGGGSDPPSR